MSTPLTDQGIQAPEYITMGLAQAVIDGNIGLRMAPLWMTGSTSGKITTPARTNVNAQIAAELDRRPEMGPAPERTYDADAVSYVCVPRAFRTRYDIKTMSRDPQSATAKQYILAQNARTLFDGLEARILTIFDAAASTYSLSTNSAVSTILANLITGIEAIMANARLLPTDISLGYTVAHDLMNDSTLQGLYSPISVDGVLGLSALASFFLSRYGLRLHIGRSPAWASVTTVYLYRSSGTDMIASPMAYDGTAVCPLVSDIEDWDRDNTKHEAELGVEWNIDEVIVNPYTMYALTTVT